MCANELACIPKSGFRNVVHCNKYAKGRIWQSESQGLMTHCVLGAGVEAGDSTGKREIKLTLSFGV